MELSSFSENIVSVPYERSGETVNLEINIDAFTPEFFRLVSKKFQERMKAWEAEDKAKPKKKAKAENDPLSFFESGAVTLEVKRQIFAELLSSGVLKGWDVTKDGSPLAPSREVLLTLPPLLVEDIWNLALESANTVKKRAGLGIRETSDSMQDGSQGLRVVGQNA